MLAICRISRLAVGLVTVDLGEGHHAVAKSRSAARRAAHLVGVLLHPDPLHRRRGGARRRRLRGRSILSDEVVDGTELHR